MRTISPRLTEELKKVITGYNTPRKQYKKNQFLIPKELRYTDYFKGYYMSFNVFKINFIDINDKDVEEIIHSDSKENAIIKLKEDYRVKKIIKTLQIPTISELKKNYGLS